MAPSLTSLSSQPASVIPVIDLTSEEVLVQAGLRDDPSSGSTALHLVASTAGQKAF
jgi:hypothetical protein